jgi:hypothetical protein
MMTKKWLHLPISPKSVEEREIDAYIEEERERWLHRKTDTQLLADWQLSGTPLLTEENKSKRREKNCLVVDLLFLNMTLRQGF